jgi:hypothetical protein
MGCNNGADGMDCKRGQAAMTTLLLAIGITLAVMAWAVVTI